MITPAALPYRNPMPGSQQAVYTPETPNCSGNSSQSAPSSVLREQGGLLYLYTEHRTRGYLAVLTPSFSPIV